MIRYALLLCAGLLAALCFACVQAPVRPFATGPTCRADGSLFLIHLTFVQNSWNPNPMNPVDPPPQGIATPIANTTFAAALLNSFQLAPTVFQDRLCGLGTIFVNGSACNSLSNCLLSSWGYRASRTGTTHIAISAGLWGLTCLDGPTYAYHCFESDLLAALLNWPAAPAPPRYAPANPAADTFDMTILAALAHEVGHVHWYEVM